MNRNQADEYMLTSTRGPMTTYDKSRQLPYPHYTDKHYDTAQTVFGPPSGRYGHAYLEYVYSDRLWQWNWDKADNAQKVANESDVPQRSVLWWEVFLSAYYERDVELVHVLAGCNWATGYAYYVFGMKREIEETT